MNVHRHIGIVFALFCLGLFCWHLTTPNNPQHDIALISMSIWAGIFMVSALFSMRVARVIQPGTLFVGAGFTVYFGNFPVAALIFGIAALVFWAYGGFRQLRFAQVATTYGVVFSVYFAGILITDYGYGPAYILATVYTVLVTLGFWLIWQLFILFASDLLTQNHNLNEANKELLKGDGKNGPGN